MFPLSLESIFKSSPIGSYLLSPTPEAIILDVNDFFPHKVSFTREDMIGRSLFDVFPDDPKDSKETGVEALRQSIAQAVATGKRQILLAQHLPIKKTLPSGEVIHEERFWNTSSTPVFDQEGGLTCVFHAMMDVTKEVQAEAALRQSEERFRSLVIATTQTVWIAEPDGNIVVDSPSWRAFTGQSYDEGMGFGWLNAVHPADRERINHLWSVATSESNIYQTEYRVRHKDGGYRWTAVRAVSIKNADGTVREWIGTNTDIEDQKRAEEELQIANHRLKLAIEGVGEGVWEWDVQRNKISYSILFEEIVGCEHGELSDDPDDLLSLIHPEDLSRVQAERDAYLQGKTSSSSCEYRIRRKDGSWKWVHTRGVLVEKSATGEPLRVAGITSDITERKESEERIWHLANFDTLTGLPNRRLFRDRLTQEVMNAHRQQTRQQTAIALLFIDLDGFKQVNDLFGHDAGDMLLFHAAQRIRQCVRDTDTVARLGGDEFTIILSGLHSTDHVELVAQKVIDALALPFAIGSEKAFVSGSIGIAVYPDDADTPEELIRKADQAMYAAKSAGKNRFSYFTREMDEEAHMRLRLIQELRHAIQLDQIHVHYQPVVELQSGGILKAEALARWTHPLFGNVEPSLFIPLAEESGVINDIGDYIFREAAATIKHWDALPGLPLEISINKSPIQFGTKDQDKWLDYLQQLELPPDRVTVEITEGVLLDVSENVSSKLFEYRDAGIQVAIDDFGTGYSSMAYLQKFDIDFLKIDQSFIKDLVTNHGNRAIAESIIAMAHKLGLRVIAEGVENGEQMALLRDAGCDYGQGYYFSRPLSANDFENMLVKRNGTHSASSLH
ncbi:EAL domain-containing protein [Noviherbaspirillum cavernae]|uniref:EAL domain-containing protein n=1 Tax=Noviherbaspirillum cavernae TaxID=2320862 RepID=A0A418WZX3_9BURK|nr:EAL domain-containing protein [Noviherbaspirillum cavernae]RJG05731.1 EAL domain-containing protein [Noviherbaspirillum cavernae]